MGFLLLGGATTASAATLSVNTTFDTTSTGNGQCSLRDAIMAVDSPPGVTGDCAAAAFETNTIVLPAGTYGLHPGELDISPEVTGLTIVGAGEDKTAVTGSGASRVLQIGFGATVTLRDLAISGGRAGDGASGAPGISQGGPSGEGTPGGPGAPGANGGGILNQGALTLSDIRITGNRAGAGGPGGAGGPSTVAPGGVGGAGGQGGAGGGVYNVGRLTLEGATVDLNQAGGGGSGGSGGGGGDGPGVAGGAGGAGGSGGGIASADGVVEVIDSTVRGNSSGAGATAGSGGAGSVDGGVGGDGGGGGDGAGLWSSAGAVSMTNSTFASNDAGAGAKGGSGGINFAAGNGGGNGGNGGNGGSAAVSSAGATLANVTVVGNEAGAAGQGGGGGNGPTPGTVGGLGAVGKAGGIAGSSDASAVVQNSLLALNAGGNCTAAVVDDGHNLSFGPGGCPPGFSSANPELGPLGDNGGPTETISLGQGSGAIDAVPAHGAGCPATDQRAVPRPAGRACDIGAYEVAPPVVATGPATTIRSTRAQLTATVTPNIGAARVRFEYGTGKAYGKTTRAQTLGGLTAVTASAKLTRLKPNATYHYRVVATSTDGMAVGRDRVFKATDTPQLGSFKISPPSFPSTGRRSGATVTYTDTRASITTFTIERCVKRSRGRCHGYAVLGNFRHTDAAGRNRLHFSGRSRGHALAPGSYRLVAVARANNKTGRRIAKTFHIVA
jgi:hypothetical protein